MKVVITYARVVYVKARVTAQQGIQEACSKRLQRDTLASRLHLQLFALLPQPPQYVRESSFAEMRILLEALHKPPLQAIRGGAPDGHARLNFCRLLEESVIGLREVWRVSYPLVAGGELREREVYGGDRRVLCCGVDEGDLPHKRVF